MKPMWGDYFFNATEGAACSGAQLKVRKDTFPGCFAVILQLLQCDFVLSLSSFCRFETFLPQANKYTLNLRDLGAFSSILAGLHSLSI